MLLNPAVSGLRKGLQENVTRPSLDGMNFHSATVDMFVPDGTALPDALSRITHLGIGAHQDDLEFMAFHGILEGRKPGCSFGGITCTDGAGSPRTGPYAGVTDEEMCAIRCQEQREAARIGGYGAMVQLGYRSSAIRPAVAGDLIDDLETLLRAASPEVLYTHNLCDKHGTHIAVALAVIEAIRRIEPSRRPRKVLGCEVWRDLDWLPDTRKVLLDVSGHEDLADALHAAFVSQIGGGKRYDLAVRGRRAAHATFHDPRTNDSATQVTLAMDLTPLTSDAVHSPVSFVATLIDEFRWDVMAGFEG